jgi:DNA (cytosine-5)-methyltransferase 1
MKFKVLDLYSGLGGLSLGFEMTEAFEIIGGIDNYAAAVKTFYGNHSIANSLLSKPQDVSRLEPERVMDALGSRPDVVVGGPPCQGFSHAGKRLGDFFEDKRNEQVLHFLSYVKAMRPKVFVMENVSGMLTTGQSRKNELLEILLSEYESIGYAVSWKVLNTANYRVPQNRKRLIVVGHSGNGTFEFPLPPCDNQCGIFQGTESIYTVADALSDLPSPDSCEPQKYDKPTETPLQSFLREGSSLLYNHVPTRHSSETLKRIQEQPVGTRLYPNWNHSWYRLDPNKPSPAVKHNNRAPFIHFRENRSVSPRECARLQTLPDRYLLFGTKTEQLIMVGNAVPAIFAAHLATDISIQFFGRKPPKPWSVDSNPILSV